MAARYYIDPDKSWDWLEQIKVGDVLFEGGNKEKPRVVRHVHYKSNGLLYSVTFTIKRCSWTNRCYTLLTRADLKTRKFSKSGVRIKKATKLDKLIAHDILHWRTSKLRLDCCDVKGIA